MIKETRIDKFLWSVRIFKTRSLSAEYCKKGKILIEGQPVKASRTVNPGDTIEVNKPPVIYSYQIIDIPKSRISAKLVNDFIRDTTPEEELQKLKLQDTFFIKRDKGSGRPTKKDRRIIDKLRNN
jgi:ribosome-associated heat shock protein Hsp15